MERIPYLGQTILKWQVGASSFLALPEWGARLMNWNVTLTTNSPAMPFFWTNGMVNQPRNFFRVLAGPPF